MLDTELRFMKTGSSSVPFETTFDRYVPKSAAETCGAISFLNSSSVCRSSSSLVYMDDSSFPSSPSSHSFDSLERKNLVPVFRMSFFARSCSSTTSSSVSFSLVPGPFPSNLWNPGAFRRHHAF